MLDAGYWMLDELGIHLFIYPVSSIQNPASHSLVGLRRSFSRLSGLKLGLLLNFNVPLMRDGIVRIVNELEE